MVPGTYSKEIKDHGKVNGLREADDPYKTLNHDNQPYTVLHIFCPLQRSNPFINYSDIGFDRLF